MLLHNIERELEERTKRLTSFTGSASGWRIEDEMKRIGANFVKAGLWRPFAIRDSNLITGQQNFAGATTAELLGQALGM